LLKPKLLAVGWNIWMLPHDVANGLIYATAMRVLDNLSTAFGANLSLSLSLPLSLAYLVSASPLLNWLPAPLLSLVA